MNNKDWFPFGCGHCFAFHKRANRGHVTYLPRYYETALRCRKRYTGYLERLVNIVTYCTAYSN